MNDRLRIAAVLLALAIPGATLAAWANAPDRGGEPFHEDYIGTQIGNRTVGAVDEWPADVLEMVDPETYLLRRYDAGEGDSVWTYVAFYRGLDQLGAGAHDPGLCYPAHGWHILDARDVMVDLGDGEQLLAKMMRVYQNNIEEFVLHWIQPGDRWSTSAMSEHVYRALDTMAGTDQYAFVRLSTRPAGGTGGEETLLEFARQIAPRVRAAVRSARGEPQER